MSHADDEEMASPSSGRVWPGPVGSFEVGSVVRD
jgi:hypothetical protein